jgi:hypothetical protein
MVQCHRFKGGVAAGFAVMPCPCFYKRDDLLIHLIPAISDFVLPSDARRAVSHLNIVQSVIYLLDRAFRFVLEPIISPSRWQELSNAKRS